MNYRGPKKHKSMDSDEDDEEPRNEPGTASNSQPFVPVRPHHQGPGASLQGSAASATFGDEDSEYSKEYSAQSQDSERTLLLTNLYVLTNDEHWTMTRETHRYAAAARSFCFVSTENGDQQDICNLIIVPCVQRSLYLDEVTNDSGSPKVEVPRGVGGRTRDMLKRCMATCRKASGTRAKMRSRARKEASAQEVRGYYKQFAEAKHMEYKSWVDSEVFDLVDLRKVKPGNYATGRWVLTIKTDKRGNFLMGKARWVLRGFQDKQKEYQQTDSPASTRPGFRMSCQMAFRIDFPQMKNLATTLELDPKGDKTTCPAFGLYSSPVKYSTMGHIVLGLTSLTYQPKSRERSARPTKRVTFAL